MNNEPHKGGVVTDLSALRLKCGCVVCCPGTARIPVATKDLTQDEITMRVLELREISARLRKAKAHASHDL